MKQLKLFAENFMEIKVGDFVIIKDEGGYKEELKEILKDAPDTGKVFTVDSVFQITKIHHTTFFNKEYLTDAMIFLYNNEVELYKREEIK